MNEFNTNTPVVATMFVVGGIYQSEVVNVVQFIETDPDVLVVTSAPLLDYTWTKLIESVNVQDNTPGFSLDSRFDSLCSVKR